MPPSSSNQRFCHRMPPRLCRYLGRGLRRHASCVAGASEGSGMRTHMHSIEVNLHQGYHLSLNRHRRVCGGRGNGDSPPPTWGQQGTSATALTRSSSQGPPVWSASAMDAETKVEIVFMHERAQAHDARKASSHDRAFRNGTCVVQGRGGDARGRAPWRGPSGGARLNPNHAPLRCRSTPLLLPRGSRAAAVTPPGRVVERCTSPIIA